MKNIIYIILLASFFGFSQVKYKGRNVMYKEKIVYNNRGSIYNPTNPTCNDGIQNGTETGIDCGGICAACEVGEYPVFIVQNPTGVNPNNTVTYTPISSADLTNVANANKIAIITNSFTATGITLAVGQTIRPNGGTITGTNINLNGAYIESNFSRAFATTATFSALYDKTRLSPENFGAIADDAIDDYDAIEALIINSAFAINQSGKDYIVNKVRKGQSFNSISRSGVFEWDWNGSTIKTTDNSTFHHGTSDLNEQGYYIFPLRGFDLISIRNGEFDGQDLASRLFDISNCIKFNFSGLEVHSLYAPADTYARTIAFNFSLNPTTGGFENGWITNNNVHDLDGAGNGISNDGYGITKAFSFSITENDEGSVYVNNNTVENILGDDAEGFYSRGDGSYSCDIAELFFYIIDNDFIACSRRAIKFDSSNALIENNLLETSEIGYSGNQAALLQVFSIQEGKAAKDVTIRGNTLRILGDSYNSFFGTNDSRDITVEDNIFYSDELQITRNLSFSNRTGQQDALYDGDLSNLIFTGNTITNGLIGILDKYYVLSGLNEPVFEDNTQNFTGGISLGAYRGAININDSYTSGTMKSLNDFKIKNHTINYDLSTMSSGLFLGVIGSNGVDPKRIKLENVTINYTGSGTTAATFAGLKNPATVNYDSTNSILNCTITGKVGTGAIEFNGADTSVVITNSFGDGLTAITVE